MFKRFFYSKIFKILLAVAYSWLFFYGYQDILYGAYEYMGFKIVEKNLHNENLLYYSFIMAVLPVFLHRGILQISSFLCIFIYLVLYIPIIFTFFFTREIQISYLMYMQFLFCIGMCILMLVDRIPIRKKIYLPLSYDIMKLILFLTWLGTVYIAFKYRGSLRFVSYEDVYIQRSATEQLGNDVFTAYFGAWLANVFIPLSCAYGVFARKKLYFISGAVASLIFYMATADKAILLFPFIILGLYFLLRNRNINNSFVAITAGLSIVMTITLFTGFNIFSALFWMRTIGNGGLLTALYHEFFADHKITYFSHINFVNTISGSYPYGSKSLGQVIGTHFYTSETNANANFWATDGIASLGNLGILVASVILSFVFYLMNAVSYKYNKLFIICVLIPYLSSLLNQSLFSSLLTGGALLLMIILSFRSLNFNPYINENSNNNRR